jgi:uncharacterized protein
MINRYQTIAELPSSIPVFPLAGALLLPRAELPLNIFEPRYLDMFNDAMAGDRVVGMIQPVDDAAKPKLSRVGCLGRITGFNETEDGRLLISLRGVCRFQVLKEKRVATSYRRFDVSYDDFAADLVIENQGRTVDREGLVKAFRMYLEANSMTANWEEVAQVSTENLVNTLSQMAPYPAEEKQALLEAPDLQSRAEMLIALTELALAKDARKSLQ